MAGRRPAHRGGPPHQNRHLRLYRGEVIEFAVFNLENDRALDRVAGPLELHVPGYALKFLDGGQGVPHLLPVQRAGLGDGADTKGCRRHR